MKFPSLKPAAVGTLRVCPENPRFFTDDSGRAIYLTGSHTWNVLTEQVEHGIFDYNKFLDLLDSRYHNFFRMWCLELFHTPEGDYELLPYPRTGPGEAVDGAPKFDLNQFHEPYFQRLRERVIEAGARGIYVGVLLFEGWWITQFGEEGWIGHPFHPSNNIQGKPVERTQMHTLDEPWVLRLQRGYVRKVIDTIHDLDNIVYEVANEDGGGSFAWQLEIFNEIRAYESRLGGKQHPVGLTFRFPSGTNEELFESQADWISPNAKAPGGYDYKTNPPPADGSKVILADTDHIYSRGLGIDWVWKSFTRGLQPLLMEGWDLFEVEPAARLAMGDTLRFATIIDLVRMDPNEKIASTGYCLAHREEKEFLVYQPATGSFTVDLPEKSLYSITWYNTTNQQMVEVEEHLAGSKACLLSPPWGAESASTGVVAYLRTAHSLKM